MPPCTTARFDLRPLSAKLNEMVIELRDIVPDDRLHWSRNPELWTFHHIFQHLCEAREPRMQRAIADGAPSIDVYANVHTKDDLKSAFRDTWDRIERVLSDQSRLDATYTDRWWKDAPSATATGSP